MKQTGLLFSFLFATVAAVPSFAQESTSKTRSLIDVNRPFLEERHRATEWERDPFVLPARPSGETAGNDIEKETGKSLFLNAIIHQEDGGTAIINHQIVREKDRIEGMTVREILSDRVILQDGSKEIELRVEPFSSE
ncbi:MAG: hypothetical protein WBK96_08160 [Candidatus Manganitrophaceae bacterium]